MATTGAEFAERFFAASASGDVAALRALCAPGFAASQNGGPTMDFDALMGLAGAIRKIAPDFRYENAVRSETVSGFVEEHDACGTLPDGTEFRLAACVVATIEDGQIKSMREYLDTVQTRPLRHALAGQ